MSNDSSGRRSYSHSHSHSHMAGTPVMMAIPSGPRHHPEWRQRQRQGQGQPSSAPSKRKWIPDGPRDTTMTAASGYGDLKRHSSSSAYHPPYLPPHGAGAGAGAGAASLRADHPAAVPSERRRASLIQSQQPRNSGAAVAPSPSSSRPTASQQSSAPAMPSRSTARLSPALDYEEGEISEESDDDESEEIARMLLAGSRARKKARLGDDGGEEEAERGQPRPAFSPRDAARLDETRPAEQKLQAQFSRPELESGVPAPALAPSSPMQLVQSPVMAESPPSQSLLPSPPRSPPSKVPAEPFRFDPTTAPFSPAIYAAPPSPIAPPAPSALEQLLEDTQTIILELQSWGVQPDYMFNQGADKDVVIRTYLEHSLPLPKHHEAYYQARMNEGLVPEIPGLGPPEGQPQSSSASPVPPNAVATSVSVSATPEAALGSSTSTPRRSSSPQQTKRSASASVASRVVATPSVQAAPATRRLSVQDDTVHAPARSSAAPVSDAPTGNPHLPSSRARSGIEPSLRQHTRHSSLPPKPQLPACDARSATISLQPEAVGASVQPSSLPARPGEMPQSAPAQPVAPTMAKTPSQDLAEKEAAARERVLARKAAMLAKKSANLAQQHIETQLNGLLASESGLSSAVPHKPEPVMQLEGVPPGKALSLAKEELEEADDVEMQISDGEEVESESMSLDDPAAGPPADLASESEEAKPEAIGGTREKLLELGDEASDAAVRMPFPGGHNQVTGTIDPSPEPKPTDRTRAEGSQPLPTPPIRSRPVAFDFEAEPASSLPNVPRWSAHLMPDSAAAKRAAAAMVIVLSDDEDSGDDSDSDGLRAAISETKLKEQAALNLAAYAQRPATSLATSSSSSSFVPQTAMSHVWQSSSAQVYSAPSPKSLPASREQSPGTPAVQPVGALPSKLKPPRHELHLAAPNSQIVHARAATPSAIAASELEAKQAEIQRMMDMISQREGKKKRAESLERAVALSVGSTTAAPSRVETPAAQQKTGDAAPAPVSTVNAHAAFTDAATEPLAAPSSVDGMQGKIERLKEELKRRKQQGKLVSLHTPGKGDSDSLIGDRPNNKREQESMRDLPAGTASPLILAPTLVDRSTSPQDQETQSDTSDDTLIITKVGASPFTEETRSSAAPSDTFAEVHASSEPQDANMDIGSQETQVHQETEASGLSPEGDITLHPGTSDSTQG